MSIYETWNIYKKNLEAKILEFNDAQNKGDYKQMENIKEKAKRIYQKFLEMLKLEKNSDQVAFKGALQEFYDDIKKMSDCIKNRQIVQPNGKGDKDGKFELKNALDQVVVTQKPNVKWTDVAGLQKAKNALKESVIMPIRFPDLFTGSRKPWKGILLYGPPGTGKTFIAKACANQIENCTFFSVSSSDIMSKYVGESQKIVKALFDMARNEESSVIFIDEVDSMTGNRSQGENQSSKRVKTQFLVQMDGIGNSNKRPLVLGATNLPWELDPAIRRRFERRIYIPLPDYEARYALFERLINKTPNALKPEHFKEIAEKTEGYSGSDISTVVKDAVYEPLRMAQKARKFRKTKNDQGKDAWIPVPPSQSNPACQYFQGKLNNIEGKLVLPDLEYKHFIYSLAKVRPSVDKSQLDKYEEFTVNFGQQG